MSYKQPRSVQVVVFAEGASRREFLLLSRVASFGAFWQTVTGSLETGETHRQAAVREVMEETGISASEGDLIDLGLVNTFEIAPSWRARYAPGVTRNEEVCFALKVGRVEPRIDPAEHDAFAWVSFEEALGMFYWESNRRALAALARLSEGVPEAITGRGDFRETFINSSRARCEKEVEPARAEEQVRAPGREHGGQHLVAPHLLEEPEEAPVGEADGDPEGDSV
ncbi:MAG TPA: dihydroneopterin triphosphate diphosphatase [Blastocatellia bacterium]|nr:dihydroneopterin triphosphate diphosphatase [Blastocatellia bacterium]